MRLAENGEMQGSFGLGLLELIAYLVPGGLLLTAVLIRFENLLARQSQTLVTELLLVATAYVIGHILAVVSEPFITLRRVTQWVGGRKRREGRYPFYPHLRQLLRSYVGEDVSRDVELGICLRLVEQHVPVAGAAAERLRALTLFARSSCLCFLITAGLFAGDDFVVVGIALTFAALMFVRYMTLEGAMVTLVFESAFVYLIGTGKRLNAPADM